MTHKDDDVTEKRPCLFLQRHLAILLIFLALFFLLPPSTALAAGPASQNSVDSALRLGDSQYKRGEYAAALKTYSHALEQSEALFGRNQLDQRRIYKRLARTARQQEDYSKATSYLLRAMTAGRSEKDNADENVAALYDQLARLLKKRGKSALSIAFGKRAVNIFQRRLDSVAQWKDVEINHFKATVKGSYQSLAGSLFDRGQFDSGQKVLELHKLKELSLYRHKAQTDSSDLLTLTPDETKAIDAALALPPPPSTPAAAPASDHSPIKLLGYRPAPTDPVDAIADSLKKANRENGANIPGNATSSTQAKLAELLAEQGQNTALLYLFFSDEVLYHVIITSKSAQVVTTRLSPAALAREVALFRRAAGPDPHAIDSMNTRELQSFWAQNQKALLKHGQWLYRKLIAPVIPQLNTSGATTLVLFVDGVLRYLPFAALHDGKQYLIEKYAISQAAGPLEITMAHDDEALDLLQVAAMGTDSAYTNRSVVFPPLHGVRKELEAVVRERFIDKIYDTLTGHVHFSGEQFFRKAFNPTSFYRISTSGKFPIIHIATHFYMKPGDQNNSALLFGTPELVTAGDLLDAWRPNKVELITFSACSTGLSVLTYNPSSDGKGGLEVLGVAADGAEVDSFAEALIRNKDIDSIISTLWDIEDLSTAKLMGRFYTYLPDSQHYTRTSALQRAQLDLLYGNVDLSDSEKSSYISTYGLGDMKHPWLWASFTLKGQWQ